MSRSKNTSPAKGANPERVRADQERRRSGAAGSHADRRTKRVRTRTAAKRSALKDWA